MPSRRFAAKYGAIRFLSCPGRAETVSKFRAVSGNAWRTPSPSPPKSAKVKLRIRTLRLRNAHCAKSLIFRPSAAERPAKRLRLLSCHRTVGLPQLRQTCDKVRYSANDGQPAIKRRAEQNRRTKRLMSR